MTSEATQLPSVRCTRREHVVSKHEVGSDVLTIAEDDQRRFRCDCGLVMIGNGHVEIRFGLLERLFPEADS